MNCFGLAGLPVVPSLGLVWPGPVLPALPATTTGRLSHRLEPWEGGVAGNKQWKKEIVDKS